MPTITLKPGLTWATLPQPTIHPTIDQVAFLAFLAGLREEWLEATGGDLNRVTLNLGLLLDDIEAACNGETFYGEN